MQTDGYTRPHGIEDLLYNRPLAILPEKLAVIEEFVRGWVAGSRLTPEETAMVQAAHAPRPVFQSRGVAVIPIVGTISQRMGLIKQASGGTSAEAIRASFREAMASAEVGTIVFDVDSPGGSVGGIEELASEILSARGKKRMIAVSNGMMASAAYWLGAAADEIVVTPSGEVGSIGVYAIHRDVSQFMERAGVKDTIIKAGKFKAEGSPSQPLSEEAATAIQEVVNEFYGRFTTHVARARGATPARVQHGFGEGRMVTARRAVSEGMADRVASFSQVLQELGVETPTSQLAKRGAIQRSSTRAEALIESMGGVQ